jgi:hypothetical protein
MSSLDGGPLLQQPNDGKHGSGCGDGLSVTVTATTEVSAGPGSRPNGPRSRLGSTIFFIFINPFFLSVGNDRYYKPFIFCIVQIVSVAGADTKYKFPTDTTNTFL